MKITIATPKPRNPLALLARSRRAGIHRPSGGAARQAGQRDMHRALQRELTPDVPLRHSP